MNIKQLAFGCLAISAILNLQGALAQETGTAPNPSSQDSAAPGGHHHGGHHGEKGGFKRIEALLTPEQKPQFDQIISEQRTKMRPLIEEMKSLKQQMQSDSPTSTASIDPKNQSRLQELKQQVKAQRSEMREKVMSVLTPEQKQQLDSTPATE